MITTLNNEDLSSDEEDTYEFHPPANVLNILHFLNTVRKWNECVYATNCIHYFADILKKIEAKNIPRADKDRIIHCLAEDCLQTHGVDAFFTPNRCQNDEDYIDY